MNGKHFLTGAVRRHVHKKEVYGTRILICLIYFWLFINLGLLSSIWVLHVYPDISSNIIHERSCFLCEEIINTTYEFDLYIDNLSITRSISIKILLMWKILASQTYVDMYSLM